MSDETILARFENRRETEHALARLRDAGIPADRVSIAMSETSRAREAEVPSASAGAADGAGVGGVWGGLFGGIVGGLVGVGSIALPGLGLLVAGPLIAALAGAGAGGAAGTFLGGLIGLGVSESEASATQDAIAAGKIVLAVHVDSTDVQRAKDLLFREGGEQIHTA